MAPTLFPASLLLLGLLVTQLKAQDPATISMWSLTTVTPTPEIASYFVKTKVTVQATNPGHGETGVFTWSTIYTTGSPYITSTMVPLASSPLSTSVAPTATAGTVAVHSSTVDGVRPGAIAGGVVGGIVGLLLLGVIFWSLLLRKRKPAQESKQLPRPSPLQVWKEGKFNKGQLKPIVKRMVGPRKPHHMTIEMMDKLCFLPDSPAPTPIPPAPFPASPAPIIPPLSPISKFTATTIEAAPQSNSEDFKKALIELLKILPKDEWYTQGGWRESSVPPDNEPNEGIRRRHWKEAAQCLDSPDTDLFDGSESRTFFSPDVFISNEDFAARQAVELSVDPLSLFTTRQPSSRDTVASVGTTWGWMIEAGNKSPLQSPTLPKAAVAQQVKLAATIPVQCAQPITQPNFPQRDYGERRERASAEMKARREKQEIEGSQGEQALAGSIHGIQPTSQLELPRRNPIRERAKVLATEATARREQKAVENIELLADQAMPGPISREQASSTSNPSDRGPIMRERAARLEAEAEAKAKRERRETMDSWTSKVTSVGGDEDSTQAT